MATQYTTAFLAETVEIINGLDADDLDAMAEVIAATKRHNGGSLSQVPAVEQATRHMLCATFESSEA